MQRKLFLAVLSLGLILATGVPCRADVMWQFSTVSTPPAGNIVFHDQPLTSPLNTNATLIDLATLSNTSTASASSPQTFPTGQGNWSILLTLVDTASGQSVPVTISGQFVPLAGQTVASYSSTTSLFDNQFSTGSPITVSAGGTTFTLSNFSFTPPGPASAGSTTGAIGLYVQVDHAAPEPTSFVLVAIGSGIFGVARMRRKRLKVEG
jgi:hypothetical protein